MIQAYDFNGDLISEYSNEHTEEEIEKDIRFRFGLCEDEFYLDSTDSLEDEFNFNQL